MNVDEVSEESRDKGVQDVVKGEPEMKGRGPRGENNDKVSDLEPEDEVTGVWNNLGLKPDQGWITEVRENRKVNY